MKKKYIIKLTCIATAIVLTLSVLVASSFAWFTMSEAPSVEGIAITLSGSNTIQFAADMTVTDENGNVLHYPGAFSDTLDFSRYSSYAYLQSVGGLTPVSTADGVHWFFPSYYTDSSDLGLNGSLKQIDQFSMDDSFLMANSQKDGTYVYLDFWVMSPGSDYSLRVSTGEKNKADGSFVMTLPQIAQDENGQLYLQEGNPAAAASMRVGFLVNGEPASDASMLAYQSYGHNSDRVKALRGIYAEQGQTHISYYNQFSIYEPNGDWHDPEARSYVHTSAGLQSASYANGVYVKTYPIGWDFGHIHLADTTAMTAVQKTSHWMKTGQQLDMDLDFQTYLVGLQDIEMPFEQIMRRFTKERLQGLYDYYVSRGDFISSSQALSSAADQSGVVSAEHVNTLASGGAAGDVVIARLEGGVAQRVRMFIWLEGQDVDCVTHQDVWNMVVRLEFAGGDQ